MVSFSIVELLRVGGVELARERAFGGGELFEELGSDGEEVAAGEFFDLAGVAEARAHDDGLVAEFLVVVVDRGDGLDAGVVGAVVVAVGLVLLVPVENAAYEGRDEGGLGFGGGDGLVDAEEEGHVAVDALFFEDLGGLDALPCGGELDEDAVAGDAGLVVHGDDVAGLRDGLFGVVGEAGVDLGGDAAGDDVEDLEAEGYVEMLEGLLGEVCSEALGPASLRACLRTPSTMGWYSGFSEAAAMREGLVVASCGLNCLIALMSPVSETTVVMPRSCSRKDAMGLLLRCWG